MQPRPRHRLRRALRAILIIAGIVLVATISLSALSNIGLATHSAVTERLSDAEKARLAEAIHLRQTLGNEVWPGFGNADIPVILYNESYAFLVGLAEPAPGWYKPGDSRMRGSAWEPVTGDTFDGQPYVRQRLRSPDETTQAFTVLVGDRWTASMTTMEWMHIRLIGYIRDDLPGPLKWIFPYRLFVQQIGSDWYISTIAHESLHAFQGTLAPEHLLAAEQAVATREGQYPWNAAGFATSWKAELELLARGVQASSRNEAAEAAQQFLRHRDQRRTDFGLSQELVAYERQREWLEGSAKYVELALWKQASLSEDYAPLDAIHQDSSFQDYAGFERHWSEEVKQMTRMAGDVGDGRFYYSGMAQGFLLDRLMPDWKSRMINDGVWLETLLEEAAAQ